MQINGTCNREELTTELRSEPEGVTRERQGDESGPSKRTELLREEKAAPKFCIKCAAHRMRIF